MKLVSWNCRGLGNPAKLEAVKDLLKSEPSDILMLQETKIEGHSLLDISRVKWNKNTGKAVSARGASEGLATLWSDNTFQLNNFQETQHWIYTELTHKVSKLIVSLFNLYVPVNYTEKRERWYSLSSYLEQHSPNNIIIAGDLNIVLKPKEKRGGSSSRDSILATMEELVQNWDLLDFPPVHGLYTWSNNRAGSEHISARMDKFLVQSALLLNKKIATTKILPKLTSDHKPIQLLLEDEEDLGPIPFRFNPLWIEKVGFMETVKAAWVKPITGSPSYIWEQKLKATKYALKEWIKKPDPNPAYQRKEAVQRLHSMQTEMENKEITAELLDEEVKARDRNTSYFHRQYRARLSQNHIAEIKTLEGQVYKGFDQVKGVVETHFRNLYNNGIQGDEEEVSDFLSNIPILVNADENTALCRPITNEEVIKVIWSMEVNKAPGPDGFTIHFYQSCWEVLKTDLLKMIRGFMRKAKIGGGINSTYLALIHKETNPDTFARFRPISLCNASYKIIAKLLANRLKPLFKKLISSTQGGFVEGRYIMDNVIQVQETIHSSKQRGEKESPWIAPLINGRPTNFFQAQRGIRQGCPLSPFLYILMADSLSRKLAAEKTARSLPGLKPSNVATPLNHALFADDSLLLGGASIRIAKAFDNVLKSYCRVTGALINESKSEIYSWNTEQQKITNISKILGFKGHAKWDSVRYLGLPISSGVNESSLWTHIISKIKSKIVAWGGYWLTKGGKTILI
eukprot:PITA_17553